MGAGSRRWFPARWPKPRTTRSVRPRENSPRITVTCWTGGPGDDGRGHYLANADAHAVAADATGEFVSGNPACDHPLVDGDKRLGIGCAVVFLARNGVNMAGLDEDMA